MTKSGKTAYITQKNGANVEVGMLALALYGLTYLTQLLPFG
jgi:hypothetical protein